MEIAKMDMIIEATKEELIKKQFEIINKYKLLKRQINDNKLMVDVLEDYEKYDEYKSYCADLVLNKYKQIRQLELLTQHLNSIYDESDNVDKLLKTTNEDYRILIGEIRNIKHQLESYDLD